jgi:predicted GNAT family acetyltransferase
MHEIAIDVRDVPQRRRFEIVVDGEVAGYATYRSRSGVRALLHTVVEPRFEGHGYASRLVTEALDATRKDGLAVEPFCPYVRDFIAKHREYLDLVSQARRAKFGLPSA